jgi:hypothetical protein
MKHADPLFKVPKLAYPGLNDTSVLPHKLCIVAASDHADFSVTTLPSNST